MRRRSGGRLMKRSLAHQQSYKVKALLRSLSISSSAFFSLVDIVDKEEPFHIVEAGQGHQRDDPGPRRPARRRCSCAFRRLRCASPPKPESSPSLKHLAEPLRLLLFRDKPLRPPRNPRSWRPDKAVRRAFRVMPVVAGVFVRFSRTETTDSLSSWPAVPWRICTALRRRFFWAARQSSATCCSVTSRTTPLQWARPPPGAELAARLTIFRSPGAGDHAHDQEAQAHP